MQKCVVDVAMFGKFAKVIVWFVEGVEVVAELGGAGPPWTSVRGG
jgi:hypothetical protein